MKTYVQHSFFIFLFFYMTGCAYHSLRSGRYVRLTKQDTLSDLAKTYGVQEEDIKSYNKQKIYEEGDWIFIPGPKKILDLASDKWKQWFPSWSSSLDLQWPVPGYYRVSSTYGPRDGKFHHGIDVPAPNGVPIKSVENGYVIHTDNSIRGFGNLTIIQHQDDYFSMYAHASRNLTQVGQRVRKGDIIALVGNTGQSSGPHLHFEWRKLNRSKDPLEYFLPKFSHLIKK
jgi:murein DD-endopeptidase MepM/ murein hydrolase activator NlpD